MSPNETKESADAGVHGYVPGADATGMQVIQDDVRTGPVCRLG